MKNLILVMSVFLYTPVFADSQQLSGPVLDISCGEVDSLEIGDACMILIQNDSSELTGVLADYNDFAEFDSSRNNNKSLIGKIGVVNSACLLNLSNKERQAISNSYSWQGKRLVFKKLKDSNCISFVKK